MRSRDDLHWAESIRDTIWSKFPERLAHGEDINDDMWLLMADRAMFRQANPLNLTMAFKQRVAMNRGKLQGYTSHRGDRPPFQDTPPVASHPDYAGLNLTLKRTNFTNFRTLSLRDL